MILGIVGVGAKPIKRGAGGVKPPGLGNFYGYIEYSMFPTQKGAFPKGPCRLCSVFSDFDSYRPKPPVPTCGPPSLLGGNKGFPYHFIDTGA